MDQLQEDDAAGAEYRNLPSVLLHGQTKHVAVVGGDAIEIAGHHADGTDVNRRAARGGGDCRRVGCVHDATICAGRGYKIGALCPMHLRKRTSAAQQHSRYPA